MHFLEHIQLYVTIRYTRRGALKINITSPHGTRTNITCFRSDKKNSSILLGMQTTLLSERDQDSSTDGFKNWSFMSVHNWGEDPKGLWTIKIMDTVSLRSIDILNPLDFQTGNMDNYGSLEDFRLVLHGTAEAPHHMKAGPRVYDENYNTVQNERSVSHRRN